MYVLKNKCEIIFKRYTQNITHSKREINISVRSLESIYQSTLSKIYYSKINSQRITFLLDMSVGKVITFQKKLLRPPEII